MRDYEYTDANSTNAELEAFEAGYNLGHRDASYNEALIENALLHAGDDGMLAKFFDALDIIDPVYAEEN